jgi:hypothetical protein
LNGLRMLSKRSNSPTALRAHSPSCVNPTSHSYSIPAAAAGIARVASGDSMLGPAPRSRSSLSAGGQLVGLHGSNYGSNSRGVMSEAGRAGMGFGGRSVGGVQGSPCAASGFGSGFFGRSSPPPQLRSCQSETATAGRGFVMHNRLLQQLNTFGAAMPAIVINAAVSEDESGGTPAAVKRAAAQLDNTAPAEDGPGVRFASVPNMRPHDGTFDPLLGPLRLPRIHTGATGGWDCILPGRNSSCSAKRALHSHPQPCSLTAASVRFGVRSCLQSKLLSTLTPASCTFLYRRHHRPCLSQTGFAAGGGSDDSGRLSDGGPALEGTCPLAVVQSGSSGSPLCHTSTSCTGALRALEQQPHQQLQQQQRRQSASLLFADGTSVSTVCPPSVDPAAVPECLQPWQEQNEPWHERQQVLLADGGVGVDSVEVGIYRQGSTTPVSLSTTMTSCMDDEYGQGAHGMQQEVGVLGQYDTCTTCARMHSTACRCCAGNALTNAGLQCSEISASNVRTVQQRDRWHLGCSPAAWRQLVGIDTGWSS